MTNEMIPLYKPHMPELPDILKILHSGQLTYGEYGVEFERMLSEYLGVKHVLVVDSFHMAIAVVLSTLDIRAGDSVIASPMGCLASTQPFASHEIKVVFADVDPKTGTLDPDNVRKKISSKTRAIFHNHFCGYPGYIEEIDEIGREYGIPVVDDGIEAFGSECNNNLLGNCGTDISVFSFTAVRNPNTIDGGAIVFNDKDKYDLARLIRDCGIDRIKFRDNMGEISPDCDISRRGYSATMSNVNAYIGICQMKCLDNILSTHRRNAIGWFEVFEKRTDNAFGHRIPKFDLLKGMVPISPRDNKPNYWVFGTLAENKNECISAFRECGFYASGVHINNSIYSIFNNDSFLPGAEEFNNRFVALPSGWWIERK